MNKLISSALSVIFVTSVSCVPSDEIKSTEYTWVPSDVLPYFDAIHKMKITGGESLYISGVIDGITGIYKLENHKWIRLVRTSDIGFARDFTVYNSVLYYGSYYGLFRVVDSEPEMITEEIAHVLAMEVYNNKLFITGEIPIEDTYYSLVSFDGSALTPVSEYYSGYTIKVVNQKMYLSGFPVIEYSEKESRYLNYNDCDFGGHSAIVQDSKGNLYISGIRSTNENKFYSIIQKYNSGNCTTVGADLMGSLDNLQIHNNTLIATGFANGGSGVCYYYEKDSWRKIDMPESFGDVIVFNNKVIGSPLISGTAFELKAK